VSVKVYYGAVYYGQRVFRLEEGQWLAGTVREGFQTPRGWQVFVGGEGVSGWYADNTLRPFSIVDEVAALESDL
jgi:hypothetical protein